MDGIESVFKQVAIWLNHTLAPSWFSDLLVNGIVAGMSGIFVFIPQIINHLKTFVKRKAIQYLTRGYISAILLIYIIRRQ